MKYYLVTGGLSSVPEASNNTRYLPESFEQCRLEKTILRHFPKNLNVCPSFKMAEKTMKRRNLVLCEREGSQAQTNTARKLAKM